MDVRAAFVAQREAAEAMQPGQGASEKWIEMYEQSRLMPPALLQRPSPIHH
jgi:hypothetical protein